MKINNMRQTTFGKRRMLVFAFLAMTTALMILPVTVYAFPQNERLELAQADNGTKPRDCKNDFCSSIRGSSQEEKAASQPQDSKRGQAFIDKYLGPATAALSALAGIAVAGSIIVGGIQYSTAGGDSGKVSAAKQRILKAILVLVAYVFFYAFLQWLLPEGV